MARQFVHGKRFFLDEFGIETEEVWLPDSFGYTAALPQLVKLAGSTLVPDPEDLVEPDQQVPPPHLLVGGHRRHPHLHPLPARRHLQLPSSAARRSPTRSATSPRRALANRSLAPVRLGRRRRRPHPRDARPGRAARGTWKARRRVEIETPAAFFDKAAADYADAARLGRRAVPGAAPRHLHQPGRDQAGQPAQRAPAARGRAVGGHRRGARPGTPYPYERARPALEDGAAPPVPRHPARLLDRLGAPRGAGDLRAGRRGAERAHRDRAARRSPATPAAESRVVFNAAPHARGGVPAGGAGRDGSAADRQRRLVDGARHRSRTTGTSSTTACCGSTSTAAAC